MLEILIRRFSIESLGSGKNENTYFVLSVADVDVAGDKAQSVTTTVCC